MSWKQDHAVKHHGYHSNSSDAQLFNQTREQLLSAGRETGQEGAVTLWLALQTLSGALLVFSSILEAMITNCHIFKKISLWSFIWVTAFWSLCCFEGVLETQFGPLKSSRPQDFAWGLVDWSHEVIQLWGFPHVYVNYLMRLPASIKCDRVWINYGKQKSPKFIWKYRREFLKRKNNSVLVLAHCWTA